MRNLLIYNRFPVLFFLHEFFVERFGSDIRSVGPCDGSAFDKSFSEKTRLLERSEHWPFLGSEEAKKAVREKLR
jgi:hypothetical protein